MCLKGICKYNYNLTMINTLATIYCQNSFFYLIFIISWGGGLITGLMIHD